MMNSLQRTFFLTFLVVGLVSHGFTGQDESKQWPKTVITSLGEINIYQPRVESFRGDRLIGMSLVSLRAVDAAEPAMGGVWFSCRVFSDRVRGEALLLDYRVERTKFFSMDEATEQTIGRLFAGRLPGNPVVVRLDSVLEVIDSVTESRPELVEIGRPPPSRSIASASRQGEPEAITEDTGTQEVNPKIRLDEDDGQPTGTTVEAVNQPTPIVVWYGDTPSSNGIWYGQAYDPACWRRGDRCSRHRACREQQWYPDRHEPSRQIDRDRNPKPRVQTGFRLTTDPLPTTTEKRIPSYAASRTTGYSRKSSGSTSRSRNSSHYTTRKTPPTAGQRTVGSRRYRVSMPQKVSRIAGGGGAALIRSERQSAGSSKTVKRIAVPRTLRLKSK